jgi:hypothetical protein
MKDPAQLDPALAPVEIYRSLPSDVRQLVVAVRTLYGGSWDDCAEDVRRRRAGRPYLYRLNLSVADELGWLHRLATYEAARGQSFEPVDLSLETSR